MMKFLGESVAEERAAADALYKVMLRLGDRATLSMPKYALEAMRKYAEVRGFDFQEAELDVEVRIEPVNKQHRLAPSSKQEDEWMFGKDPEGER